MSLIFCFDFITFGFYSFKIVECQKSSKTELVPPKVWRSISLPFKKILGKLIPPQVHLPKLYAEGLKWMYTQKKLPLPPGVTNKTTKKKMNSLFSSLQSWQIDITRHIGGINLFQSGLRTGISSTFHPDFSGLI